MGGALRLAAVDSDAARTGLWPGMTLADARARMPDVRVGLHRPQDDAMLLTRLLEDFGRFTPLAALDAPHGLMLDVTGCAHLFGGEAGLVRAAQARTGLSIRCALAATPHAARALARFGPGGVFPPGAERDAARHLGVAALELAAKDEQALRRVGLKSLADLDDRPRAPLAARFGADFATRLARVLGEEDTRITPHRPPPPVFADRMFFEPVSTPEDIERILSDLLASTARILEERAEGGRAFEAGFYRVDGVVRRIAVRTGKPMRDAPGLLRLFRERLAALSRPLDPGFGFDQIRMAVPVVERLTPVQDGLEHATPGAEELHRLIDWLTARLGPDAAIRFEPLGSHIPERAARLTPAGGRAPGGEWPALYAGDPPMRPLQMFDPPQPIETLAEAPDGYPFRFRWRRAAHAIVRAEGPERIEPEWRRDPDGQARDYYRVEDSEGRRFWLFRQGRYGGEAPPRWFIHGLFP